MLDVIETTIDGVLRIEPRVFGDTRGFFLETFSAERYREAGIDAEFVQDNLSRSTRGTLRGLHYQLPRAQGKLIWVVRGEVFDVAVDLRRGSPTFGRWCGATLSDENHHQLYVPPGCAHGFCVQSEFADVAYKCTAYYHPEDERTILWDDPELAVDWPLAGPPLISEKDRRGVPFREAEHFE